MRTNFTFFATAMLLGGAIALPTSFYAQAGALDLSFDADGIVTSDFGTSNDYGNSVALQSDGKIVVVGTTENAGNADFAVVRYNPDGSLDNSFDTDGRVSTDLGTTSDNPSSVAIQADGKIVVAGYTYNVAAEFVVVRYNTDGGLDTTFDTDGILTVAIGTDDAANEVVIQSDGKIVVAGVSNTNLAVVRLNSDGSLDPTFDGDGMVLVTDGNLWASASSVAIQSDGKIVAAGSINNAGMSSDFFVVRLDTNGTLDPTFDTDGKAITPIGSSNDYCESVAIQSDGKIVVGGIANIGGNYDFALARLTTNGSLDNSFDGDGTLFMSFGTTGDICNSIAIQSDGKILAAGYRDTGPGIDLRFALARFDANGALDNTFDTDGKLTTNVGPGIDVGSCLAVQSDGKILLAGVSSNGSNDDFAVVRYHNDFTSGIEDFGGMNAESTVYPNPFTQGTTLKTNSELENATLEIFNVHGQKVQMLENLNGKSVSISRADLPGGIYFVTLSQDNIQIAQHKVIIVD